MFTDLLLADEINRTPPKTQAALLEAMQERTVTIDGESYPLGEHFTVVATQNPIEQQGVYPLPGGAARSASCSSSGSIIPMLPRNARSSPATAHGARR